jgi:uncharacterized protein (DUF433 family)
MNAVQDKSKSDIIRTERGLSITGTRITLYDLMDYIHSGYPVKLIRNFFYITDQQFNAAICFIESHREQVESEYQQVLQEAEVNRQYWEQKNKERFAQGNKYALKTVNKEAWEKLQVWKTRLATEA